MISKKNLKIISGNRIKDAEVLLRNRRYECAIYICGYAIETALKFKICETFNFRYGFPENHNELNSYSRALNRVAFYTIARIKDIKHHDFSKLLFYTGAELNIKSYYLNEWTLLLNWNPENRYKVTINRKVDAANNIESAKKIVKELFK